jgi:hypothetical protein
MIPAPLGQRSGKHRLCEDNRRRYGGEVQRC